MSDPDLAPVMPARTDDTFAALHPLVRHLVTKRAYPYVETASEVAELDGRDHLLFLPSHGKGHLETPDIAAVLPELVATFGGPDRIGGAVAGPALEAALRDELSLALPALVVVRAGAPAGAIARMRDWDDYLARLGTLLAGPSPATH